MLFRTLRNKCDGAKDTINFRGCVLKTFIFETAPGERYRLHRGEVRGRGSPVNVNTANRTHQCSHIQTLTDNARWEDLTGAGGSLPVCRCIRARNMIDKGGHPSLNAWWVGCNQHLDSNYEATENHPRSHAWKRKLKESNHVLNRVQRNIILYPNFEVSWIRGSLLSLTQKELRWSCVKCD